MLRTLSISDFVIVDALDIEFDAGFTVFSGETGAGKSILVDALALALGARGDAGVVRGGAARADISASFDANPPVARWLELHALDTTAAAGQRVRDADDAVLLRRVIDAGGRSRAFINGVPATLAQLRELGEMLVDIHGQHAHQLLLRGDAQRDLFDTHSGLGALVADTAQAWRAWRAARQALEDARGRERAIALEREQLAWQIGELEKLAPSAGEWEEIGAEHRLLSHSASLIDGVREALDTLVESDSALLGRLGGVIGQMHGLADIDARLGDVLAALEPAEIQLREAAHSLSHYAQRLELDPARLAQVEARLDALHSAARRFRLRPEALPAELAARRTQLAALDAAADLDALAAAEAQAGAAYQSAAQTLSAARRQAAPALSGAVTTGMQELSMAGGRFEVVLLPLETGNAHGLEQVEFRVAGHAGVALRPLAKVASGGELARISLALSVIASAASPTPTLIFDEVDAGIGGAVAEVVGRLLHQLGGLRQVLCVTHLPQVAARGDQHFRVAKSAHDDGPTLSTVSTVIPLDRAGRVEEIARMLGGIDITPTTRKHARELLAV